MRRRDNALRFANSYEVFNILAVLLRRNAPVTEQDFCPYQRISRKLPLAVWTSINATYGTLDHRISPRICGNRGVGCFAMIRSFGYRGFVKHY